MKQKRLSLIIIFILVIVQYVNTLSLDYTLDDRLVIFNNEHTVKGFDGVGEVFTKDGFSGYFTGQKSLVAGGRYRPLAQFTFIVEYEIFGQNIKKIINSTESADNEQLFMDAHLTFVSHFVNLLLYLLLVWVVYLVLTKLFPIQDKTKWYFSIPFLATLIFALHPLHTEAVANIKGRDEIMSMLGSMFFILCILKYVDRHKIMSLFFAFLAMLFALFSKENAITFLAIAPLTLFFYHIPKKRMDWCITLLPALTAIVIFLIFRTYALGTFMPEDVSNTILNNPYLNSTPFQKIATIILTYGIYLKLLIFPHPLTHDYYPKHIEITNFSNPVVIILLLFFIFITYYAVKNLRNKNIVSFGILFFIITFSIVSNLLFSVGTFMNERFLFVSLLGFAVILAFYIHQLSSVTKRSMILSIFLIVLFSGYMVKGITRNMVWKDDFTLFTTDVKTSFNSIKCNVSAGGSYLQQYKKSQKKSDLNQSFKYLNKAVELDKYSYYAHSLLGEAYFLTEDYQLAYQYFKNAIQISPNDETGQKNLQSAEQMLGYNTTNEAETAMNAGNFSEAMKIIDQYIATGMPTARVYNIKGKIFGMGMNQLDSAIKYLHKALELDPDFYPSLENLGVAHAIKREYNTAINYLLKAYELAPDNPSIMINLANVYRNSGNSAKAKEWESRVEGK